MELVNKLKRAILAIGWGWTERLPVFLIKPAQGLIRLPRKIHLGRRMVFLGRSCATLGDVDVSQGIGRLPREKIKQNQRLPRNPQIKPYVRLPRDCHQTIPTSPKMINQTIFTSPKVKTPYHINISQGKNHTIFTSPKVKTIPSQHLPRNKTIRSLYLPSKKTKPTWHIPRKQNHTILTPPKFKPNNHNISQTDQDWPRLTKTEQDWTRLTKTGWRSQIDPAWPRLTNGV